MFIKQVPKHPPERFKKLDKMKLNYKTSSYTSKRQVKKKTDGEEVTFIKHVSVHPRDRLKKKKKRGTC